MSTRRSRSPRSRKSRNSEVPQNDVSVAVPVESVTRLATEHVDPSQTSQLRALEAGWDELLA